MSRAARSFGSLLVALLSLALIMVGQSSVAGADVARALSATTTASPAHGLPVPVRPPQQLVSARRPDAGSPVGTNAASRAALDRSSRLTGVAAEEVAGPGSAIVKYSYPPNRGFLGGPVRSTLRPGTVVDRYGADSGTFVSPQGTPFGARSLPPSSLSKQFNTYEVVNPVEVNGGTVAPWFGQGGGGIQYEFDQSIADLIEGGFLKAVG